MAEIAHEALVRRWPRLSQWLQEDREILVWRQRLGFIIRERQQTGRDDGFLLRGSLLDEARLWSSRRASDLTPSEKEYIQASVSILFDMMHIRGRYADAAELIRQELALHPPNAEVHSPLLLPLKIRFIHHQMFYRPVHDLWTQMLDLLACCDPNQDCESYGEILFMLGGNLGSLRGNYEEARRYLLRAIRHAQQTRDHYILARCLRKYGDFLRYRGHLQFAKGALLEALRLSGHGRGTRQRMYILGCLGDLERQK